MIVDGQWPTTFWDTIHGLQTATEWTKSRSSQLDSAFEIIVATIQNDLN